MAISLPGGVRSQPVQDGTALTRCSSALGTGTRSVDTRSDGRGGGSCEGGSPAGRAGPDATPRDATQTDAAAAPPVLGDLFGRGSPIPQGRKSAGGLPRWSPKTGACSAH